jgi:hypothetical protein
MSNEKMKRSCAVRKDDVFMPRAVVEVLFDRWIQTMIRAAAPRLAAASSGKQSRHTVLFFLL